jgi:hypothetical protein
MPEEVRSKAPRRHSDEAAPARTSWPRANPTGLSTPEVRWIPTSLSANRNWAHRPCHGSLAVTFGTGLYGLYGQVCWFGCAVAVLDMCALYGAPLRTELRERAKRGRGLLGAIHRARAEGHCWREVGCDDRQGHPSTRADAQAHANAIVMILHVPPVAARAGAALAR